VGKIADAIRGMALPIQNKTKLLTLDDEFSEMEAEIQTLKAQNLSLQAKVNPLEREIQRLKDDIKKYAASTDHDKLDRWLEKILIEIANHGPLTREHQTKPPRLSTARLAHYFDILVEKGFIEIVPPLFKRKGTWFAATVKGRKYLARHDLL
jgi:hypothetical protein